MHGESLKVGGAFQTMSEVVNSARQRHLQHKELDIKEGGNNNLITTLYLEAISLFELHSNTMQMCA